MGYFLFTQQIYLNFPITQEPSSPVPTLKPTATQTEKDKWELGVLKLFMYWNIPVQGEFYRWSNA